MKAGLSKDLDNPFFIKDLERIRRSNTDWEKLRGSSVVITGCAGFLGFSFMHFFACYAEELGIKKIIGIDNFQVRKPDWLVAIESLPFVHILQSDITTLDLKTTFDPELGPFYVLHMASIASPTFYRKYPLETIKANVFGLERLLSFFVTVSERLKGFLFFSSSEVYGDPLPQAIPTPESYLGRVACVGPRACYDESKRLGETLAYVFSETSGLPITIVRPFNNYGPGLNLDDKRVPADFAKAIIKNEDIIIRSDGSPTRTFCYVSDAIDGFLKALIYPSFDVFNIGIDSPEISIKTLAELYQAAGQRQCDYSGKLHFEPSQDPLYLTDNPNRRLPDISKAKKLLSFQPTVPVDKGVTYFLSYLQYQLSFQT